MSFDLLLLKAIDESLSVMGEEPKKALYQYLLSDGHLELPPGLLRS